MSRDSLSLFVTRGKRYFVIALAVALLGLGTARAPGQEEPPGDMAEQAASAGEEAYKLVQANKLDEARLAYAKIVTDYQATAYAVWDPAITAINHVLAGDDEAAGAVIEQMNQDYAANPFIAKALNKIGDKYRDKKKYPQALGLYQRIVDTWPQADYAVWAQKSLVTTNFSAGDSEKADTAQNNLLTNFANHPQLESAVYMLAGEFLRQKRYAQSRDLYQVSTDRWPQGENAIRAQQGLAITNIKMGNYGKAQTAVETLLSDFSSHPQVAQAVNKVGDHYRWAKRYELARALYQQLVDTWPKADYALWAQKSLVTTHFLLQDDEGAHAQVLKFLSEFVDHKKMPEAANMLAWECVQVKKYTFAKELQRFLVEKWPQGKYALEAQKGLVISHLKLKDDAAAQRAYETVIKDYTQHPQIAAAVNKIGDHYFWDRNYQKAQELFQYVLDHWPDAECAIWSQKSLAAVLLRVGDNENADTAIEELFLRYGDHKQLRGAVTSLAAECRRLGQVTIARELDRFVLSTNPQGKYALLSLKGLVLSHLRSGDFAEMETALDRLLTDFDEQGGLAEALLDISPWLRHFKKYDKAKQLGNHILDSLSPSEKITIRTEIELAKIEESLGLGGYVIETMRDLIEDYPENTDMPELIFLAGEEYYEEGFGGENEDNPEKAHANFFHAIKIWDIVIRDLPVDRQYTPMAYYFSATCFARLGDYQIAIEYYQKVIDTWPDNEKVRWARRRIEKHRRQLANLKRSSR